VPKVKGKSYPYTKAGIKAASAARKKVKKKTPRSRTARKARY
jgi:hypothetical protein